MPRYKELYSIDQIKQVNSDLGHHFFDADTIRFFNSRASSDVYSVHDGAYFITSEQYKPLYGPSEPRCYTLRFCNLHGKIETISEFQEYSTPYQAKKAAKQAQANHVSSEAISEYMADPKN